MVVVCVQNMCEHQDYVLCSLLETNLCVQQWTGLVEIGGVLNWKTTLKSRIL